MATVFILPIHNYYAIVDPVTVLPANVPEEKHLLTPPLTETHLHHSNSELID